MTRENQFMFYLQGLQQGDISDKFVFQIIDHCLTGEQYTTRQLIQLCEQYLLQPNYRSNYLNLVVLQYQNQKIIKFSLNKLIQELSQQDYIIPGEHAKIYIIGTETFIQFRNNFFRCFKSIRQDDKDECLQFQLTTQLFFAILNKDYEQFVKITGFKGLERKIKEKQQISKQLTIKEVLNNDIIQGSQQEDEEYEEYSDSTGTLSSMQTSFETIKTENDNVEEEPVIDLQLEDQLSLSFTIDEDEFFDKIQKDVDQKRNLDGSRHSILSYYSGQNDLKSHRTRLTSKSKYTQESKKSKVSQNERKSSQLQQVIAQSQLNISDLQYSQYNSQSKLMNQQLQPQYMSKDAEYIEEEYEEYDSYMFMDDNFDLDEIHKNLPKISTYINNDWIEISYDQLKLCYNQQYFDNQITKILFKWKDNIKDDKLYLITNTDIILNIKKLNLEALSILKYQLLNKWQTQNGIVLELSKSDIQSILESNIQQFSQTLEQINIQDRPTIFQLNNKNINIEDQNLQQLFNIIFQDDQNNIQYQNIDNKYQYIIQQMRLGNTKESRYAAIFYLSQDEKELDLNSTRPELQYKSIHEIISDLVQMQE